MIGKMALLGLVPAVAAVALPAPAAAPTAFVAAVARAPEPTAQPAIAQRGLLDEAGSYIDSLGSDVASGFSSLFNSGILDFHGLPTGSSVLKSLDQSAGDLDAKPTQVLNLPAYANWTDKGWNVRVHGNVYKIPDIDQSKVDDLANAFLIDTSVSKLDKEGQAQARNVTKSIYVVQQEDVQVTIDFVSDVTADHNATGGVVNAAGGDQKFTLPYNTTTEGDFDTWVQLKNKTTSPGGYLLPGNATSQIQALNMYANGTTSGNATAYLVPTKGTTVISDIDDILRVTKIYDPKEGLLNTFARPFTPWLNMPEIYANWSSSLSDFHFHYLTTTPEQITRNYMDFIYQTYPLGSFDTRPLNFSDVKATLSIRRFLLDKIFLTYPERRFILVADTSNSDVMKDYPAMYSDYPGQVSCILLRNTSSTDSADHFPYDTSGFKDIPKEHYMFFNVPDDLTNLDVSNGHCLNGSVAQNLTFGYQGLPFGLGDDTGPAGRIAPPNVSVMLIAGFAAAILAAAM